ncbi:MAG: glycosyltransferase [archaeon]
MISIIIPAFNAEKIIGKTIKSLLNQKTRKSFEIVVIDDGSTDGTLNALQKFKSNKKIRVFSQQNSGPAIARNNGVKKASGEIIVFIDSDCVAESNWLEEMVKPFENEKVAGVQGAYKTNQRSLTARFIQVEILDRYKRMQKSINLDWIGSYSAAYRKKPFLLVGGFDPSFKVASGEDPELSFKLNKFGWKLKFNPKAIVYHIHPETLMDYIKTKFVRAYWSVNLWKKHPDKAVKDSYTPQIMKLQIIMAYHIIAAIFFGFIWNSLWSAIILFVAIILLSSLKFTFFALKQDFSAGMIAPLMVFLRALTLALGMLKGLLRF